MVATMTAEQTLEIPLGERTEAEVELAFGGGELKVGEAPAGMVLAGTFEGGAVESTVRQGTLRISPLTPGLPIVTWRPLHWDVGVTAEVPVTLRLDTGANRSEVDLSGLRIRRLEIHTGASETNVRLPAAGRMTVRVECGFAAVSLEVPAGVAARIRGVMALGALNVDSRRFPRTADGWASPEFETAPNRVDIIAEGGFGSVRIA